MSRRLNARRSRPSSSMPPGSRRRETSVVSASSSTVEVRLFRGPSTVRPTARPSRMARATPRMAMIHRAKARWRSSWFTPVSGRVSCSAPPSAGVASMAALPSASTLPW